MNRSYIIKPIHSSMRLDRWIRNNVGHFPQSLLQKSIRKGSIKLNKNKTSCSYKLQIGDEISFLNFAFKNIENKINSKYVPTKKYLNENEKTIIENNENFLVLNKKAGIPVQGGTKSKKNLIDTFAKSKMFAVSKPYSVHRLDKDTSGVMIIAKNHSYAKLLTTLFRLRKVHKTYLAICHGILKKKKGEIRDELIRYDNKKKILETAITNFRVIKENNFLSFVELKPLTGRKHQLRKQLMLIGNPIIGDNKYNLHKLKKNSYKNLMLHAFKLSFFVNDKKFTFKANPPDYFNEYLKKKKLIF